MALSILGRRSGLHCPASSKPFVAPRLCRVRRRFLSRSVNAPEAVYVLAVCPIVEPNTPGRSSVVTGKRNLSRVVWVRNPVVKMAGRPSHIPRLAQAKWESWHEWSGGNPSTADGPEWLTGLRHLIRPHKYVHCSLQLRGRRSVPENCCGVGQLRWRCVDVLQPATAACGIMDMRPLNLAARATRQAGWLQRWNPVDSRQLGCAAYQAATGARNLSQLPGSCLTLEVAGQYGVLTIECLALPRNVLRG